MGETTGISWCDHTFNIVWGCTKVSEGCRFCYAETLAKRWGFDVWGPTAPRRTFADKHWAGPVKWNEAAKAEGRRHRVFCQSMGDVFEDHPTTIAQLPRLWDLIYATPNLDWQLLTKRPERIKQSLPEDWGETGWHNVWLGTSVEDQAAAEKRVPILCDVPARVRFLSVEPMLGPVNLEAIATKRRNCRIDWIICGGESGPDHRPFDPAWARSLRDSCLNAGVSFWFKQHGGLRPTSGGHLLDGREHYEFPVGVVAGVQEAESPATANTNEEAKGQRCARHNERDCPMPDCEQEAKEP